MVFRPQKTKFQLKIVENIQTLSFWANNPWRRYSISLITLLIGYFFGSSLGMVSAVVELMDPVAAFLSVVFIEMHLGIKEDDLFPEPGELRGLMAQLEALLELIEGNTKIQSNSEAA